MKGTYQHGGLGPNSDMDTLVSQAVKKGRELGKVSSHGEPYGGQCSAKSHVARGYGELTVEI